MMMLDEKLSVERQRTAWMVLIASFTVFTVICISTPVIINAVLQNSARPLDVLAQANQGTVGIDDEAGGRRATIVGDAGQSVTAGEHVLTGNTATALVSVRPPESEQLLASFQIYSNTDFHLLEAETPRFAVSNHGRTLIARLDNGRVRVNLNKDEARPFAVRLITPQGELALAEPGQYAVVVTPEDTQVTVQAGQADIFAAGEVLPLPPGARARIPNGSSPEGPLGTERDLIANGGFSRSREQWILNPWIVERAAQPEGLVRTLDVGGDPRLNITRQGVGHAEVSLRQAINQDVSELTSLRLLLTFRILNETLGVCGVKGSECPLFVRVNYVDEAGGSSTWQQGFYATGEPDPNLTPDSCTTCAMVQGPHIRVPMQQDYFFEIADFREELARHGRLPPRFIESVTLVFSGHGFEVEVDDVALLAEE
ncbi:MAG TPA: hypothetical protein PLD25_04415 [Chloroflexota bacterium]|nr:hypothetical protein [Chloroflexota bacterium]HUM71409.1 hypothetical protein [Chloroflexota bacterium]